MGSKHVELRVGLFVLAALLVGGTLTFVVGNQENIFRSKLHYHAYFDSVGGLRAGSPVSIAGVDVGTVSEVRLGDNGQIYVEVGVIKESARLIRKDSIVTIGNKGLLGDKLVDIKPGKGAPLPNGGRITSESPVDIGQYMTKAANIIRDTEGTVKNLRIATQPFTDPTFAEDIKSSAKSLSTITSMASKKGGIVDRLSDPETVKHIEGTLAHADALTAELTQTSKSINAILAEVERGDGTAHELVYGESGKKLVKELGNASGELALAMAAIRTGDGAAHKLIYENDGAKMVENLTASSEHLRYILDDVRAGKGTIGGLLVDPSIYEDVKRLVGDLQRNDILRALVRYSIRQDAPRAAAKVTPAAE